jgi:hypothetical protein
VGPFAASKNNQQGQMGHWGRVLDNGPNIDPFHTSKEFWVTEGIFFNGVVPWEILIIVFF